MTRSPSPGDEDTQELTDGEHVRESNRKERRKSSGPLGRFRNPESLVLLLALVSLLVLLPLRGGLSAAPVLPFLAAFVLFMVPGLLLSLLLSRRTPDESLSGLARLPVAFVFSAGIFGVLAVPFLFLNRSIDEYLLLCGVVLLIALGFALYRLVFGQLPEATGIVTPFRTATDLLWLPFAVLAGALAYVSAVMEEEPNGDSWIYLAYVRDYTNADKLTSSNPILGGQAQDSYISFRTTINGWLLEQAALSRVSGLAPVDLVLDYLAPTLVVLSLLAVYALARVLFGKGPALVVGSLTALLFLLDLQATFPTALLSPGNDFVARITEDKYVTRFLFLPVSLGLAVLYLRGRKLLYLAAFAVVCWSVVVVHPIGLILIGISVAGLGFFHLISNLRERGSWKAVLGLGAAIAIISVPPVLYLLATGSPLLSRLSGSVTAEALIETWVSSRRLLVLGGDSYIVHPSFLLNPAVIAAYALGISFVVFRLKRDLAAQLLLGILVFAPLLIYVPPISTPLAKIVGPWVLVRLSWPISLAAPLVIGWVVWRVLEYAKPRLESSGVGVIRYVGALLPVLVVLVLVAATSPASIAAVRTANETGELPREQASCSDPVFRWMQDGITEPGTVLAPYMENSCIPAYSADANVVTLRGLSASNRAEQGVFNFYSSSLVKAQGLQFLRREGVTYVLLPASSPLNAQLGHLPGFTALDNPGDRYKLYGVNPDALVETLAVTANSLMESGNFDLAAGYYTTALGGDANEQFMAYMGLGLSNSKQGLYEEAAANYEAALELFPEEPTLYPLLSNAYESAGMPDLARLALENGVDRFPDNLGLRTDLGELLMSEDPAAAAEVQRQVVDMFPDVPGYRIKLGAYLALSGDGEAADQQFERALREAPLSGQLHANVGLANQTSGRRDAAIRHYERALELDPGLQETKDQLEGLRQ
ncbi:MAG: DUF6077 domain-containing protein [Rubrobacteraceae bacterium]